MLSASKADRLPLLISAARAAGILTLVSEEAARSCRGSWDALLAEVFPPLLPRVPSAPDRRAVRRRTDPAVPPVGTWVSFRPHITSDAEVFQVVAYCPNGAPIDSVLSPAQVRLLPPVVRIKCFHGDRVVLGVPGGMHLIASLKTSLLGAFLARAAVIQDPPAASPTRLVVPLEAGAVVSWVWHSSFGPSHRFGVVVAYVPGGVSLAEAAPSIPRSCRLRGESNLDRYLVRVHKHPFYLTPPAFLVERAMVEATCSSAS